jgi:IS5 family transposase
MRKVIQEQRVLGSEDISRIEIDLSCRDEMPKIMLGFQYIYCTKKIREEVFKILEDIIPSKISKKNGRPGMELWKILVLGCVRLNNNCDYDKLQDFANNHRMLREMLGHGLIDKHHYYRLQTLKDNVSLFTPEILSRINHVVVKAGHRLTYQKKNENIGIKGKCDSFVLKTDSHYPTDINLLLDAIRIVISSISRLCSKVGINGWRKSNYNLKTLKGLYRKIQKLRRSTSKDEKKKTIRDEKIKQAYEDYLSVVKCFLDRAEESLLELKEPEGAVSGTVQEKMGACDWDKVLYIERFLSHAHRQIDQIKRRVFSGEKIPHEEKVFSLFEEHTEWISKGKAGVPQELGLRVCIVEDQHHFILHHRVMEKESDTMVAVEMVRETKKNFNNLKSCSFDKGFYSPNNRIKLSELLETSILPKKGRISQADKELADSEEYAKGRQQHAGVESAINALENHGLDRCLDHGITGFKRYVALAVLSRNIHVLGNIIHKKKVKSLKRRDKPKNQSMSCHSQKAA